MECIDCEGFMSGKCESCIWLSVVVNFIEPIERDICLKFVGCKTDICIK